jgi:CrcB protein
VKRVLLVGLGGAIGSILRYGLGTAVGRVKGATQFPLETLTVNVLGCLVAGMLAGWAEARGPLTPELRAFLFVGILGGFTTFSAFGYETFGLFRDGLRGPGLASVALQLVLGVGAVWGGHALIRGQG